MNLNIDKIDSFREWIRLHRIVESLDSEGDPMVEFAYKATCVTSKPPFKVAALPASFNPLTNAHVELLEAAEARIELSEFLLILDKKTIDKELYGASHEDRLFMLGLFAQRRRKISILFSSHGLFLDKAVALRRIYPEGTDIYFIVGYDTLARLFDPRYYEDRDKSLDLLFSMSRFLVGNRGDDDEESVGELMDAPGNRKYREWVETIRISHRAADMSSTEARARVGKSQRIDPLVPEEIEYFIRESGLYADPEGMQDDGEEEQVGRYEVRCKVFKQLFDIHPHQPPDLHVRQIVEAVMGGEDIKTVIGRFLGNPRQ